MSVYKLTNYYLTLSGRQVLETNINPARWLLPGFKQVHLQRQWNCESYWRVKELFQPYFSLVFLWKI